MKLVTSVPSPAYHLLKTAAQLFLQAHRFLKCGIRWRVMQTHTRCIHVFNSCIATVKGLGVDMSTSFYFEGRCFSFSCFVFVQCCWLTAKPVYVTACLCRCFHMSIQCYMCWFDFLINYPKIHSQHISPKLSLCKHCITSLSIHLFVHYGSGGYYFWDELYSRLQSLLSYSYL